MARYYRVAYTGTLTNAGGNADLLEILPADDKPCYIVRAMLSQTSEIQDAAEENLQLSWVHLGATVTGGNGTAVTPALATTGIGAAAGFAAECNGATVATTSGTTTILEYFGWNIRGTPLIIDYPDEDWQPSARQGEALLLRCDSTPTDDITIQLTFIVREE